MIRRIIPLTLLLAAPLAAQDGLPSGWEARLDRSGGSALKLATMGPGLHLSPGGSGIAYRPADKVSGKFHAVAKFVQTKAPSHPEAYGLFYGGADLEGEGQQYTYFIVRGDGKFAIKQRNGAKATSVVEWTDSPALVKQDADGKATNTLEIDATGAKIIFKANGKSVYEMEGPTAGVVGLRLNHGLDVHIDGYGVHPS